MQKLHCIFFIFALFVVNTTEAQNEPTCGLQGISSTPENPFRLPVFSDYPLIRTMIWQVPFFGDVNTTTRDPHPHFPYIEATRTTSYYRLYSNSLTRTFPRTFDSREIVRVVNINCLSDTVAKYYLVIPLQDMTAPEFTKPSYTMQITTDWGTERPISEGQFVIVSDHDYELLKEELGKTLMFTTPNNELRVESVKLWVEPNPEKFSYRLDLFLQKDLPPGKLEIRLSSSDDFNSGSTIIEMIVT